jgi:thiol:disulfide interchange protein DsbA
MNLRRRTLVLALGLAPFGAYAQARQPAPGVDYTELKPSQPVETQGKIEVVEFFWYGCPHCYTLEPLLEKWIPTLPADVQFRRIPAVFNAQWARDAGIYYAFDALGVVGKVHRPFFDAIHRDHLRTDNPQALAEWLQRNKVRRATQLSAAYRIDGTPALAVHGRFTVSAEQARTQRGMLATTEYLIGVARKGGAG